MKIAYILPVNMSKCGYTLSNFLSTHFSVKTAQLMSSFGCNVSLHTFWNKALSLNYQGINIRFYKTDLPFIFNPEPAEVSFKLLFTKFDRDTMIHFHEPNRLFFILFYLKNIKNKIIIENHGIGIINPYPIKSCMYWLYGILRRTILPILLRKSNKCLVLNQESYDNLRSYGLSSSQLVKTINGIDIKEYQIFDKKLIRKNLGITKKKLIIFVGRITRSKGITELINAFRKIKRKFNDADLAIIGPLEDTSLMTIIKPYWKGFKESKELQKWYSAADVFCLPSYNQEGMPISVIEAMYYNLSIILTKTSGSLEFAQYFKPSFVKIGDVNNLVRTLSDKLSGHDHDGYFENTRQAVEKNFTLQKVCQCYLKIYRETQ